MAGLIRLGGARLANGLRTCTRKINTSSQKTTVKSETCPVASDDKKNWISFGFSTIDPFVDKLTMHVSGFMMVSLILVFGGTMLVHAPDPHLHEWSQREAYLELRRREALGLPPIDADYIDPAKINLPTDEELGNTEIII